MALEPGRILHPLLLKGLVWEARRIRRTFRRSLDIFARAQERTLLAKIRRNADSQFGREHGFAAIRSVADFRRAVPVATYEDYEPYIEEVRHGRTSALFGRRQRIRMFAMTSGTTSRPKYIPVPQVFLKEYRRGWMTWGIHTFLDHPPPPRTQALQLVSPMDDETYPCGLTCGAMSGLSAHVQRRAARNIYVLPPEAVGIRDTAAKYYVGLLLALPQTALMILSANPSTLLGLARTLDTRRDDLLRDLHDGTLNPQLDLEPEIRWSVARRLRAHPERAAQLERSIAAEGGLYPKNVWHLPFLGCWKGGTLSLYLREFPHWFGAAPVRDIGLIASEGRMTIPLGDEGSAGVLDGQSQFFEFIEARDGRRTSADTLLPAELDVGREYFLLLTNSAGLYRYDIGDVVRVEGFMGGSPLVTFLNKGAHYSSLTGEKLSEHQVVEAVNEALSTTGLALTSYCLAPAWTGGVPHYVLMVEQADAADEQAARGLGRAVEHILRGLNIEYNAKRSSGRLGPLRLKVVPTGTWQQYDQRTIAERRRGPEQYKHKFLVADVEFERAFPAVAEYD